MILGAFSSFFKRILTLFIRAVAWLIVALSLWIPLLYSLAFLIICALANKNPVELGTIFWAGMAVCIVLAFFLSGYFYERKRIAKNPRATVLGEKVSQRGQTVELKKKPIERENAPLEDKPIQSEQQFPASNQAQQYQQAQFPASNQAQQTIQEDNIENGYPIQSEFMQRKDSFGGNAYQKSAEYVHEPRIFATRKDPTIFVYEYPDRLEFYKRTRNGMILMETKYKT